MYLSCLFWPILFIFQHVLHYSHYFGPYHLSSNLSFFVWPTLFIFQPWILFLSLFQPTLGVFQPLISYIGPYNFYWIVSTATSWPFFAGFNDNVHKLNRMPEALFKVDLTKPMDQQEMPGHNRWHPDIPAVASVNAGDTFRIECKDWTDGQIKRQTLWSWWNLQQ